MLTNEFFITFHAQNFDATQYFYEQILRFDYLRGWSDETGRGAVFALSPGGFMEFFGAPEGQPQSELPPQNMKLAFLVDDVDAIYQRIIDHVTLVDDIADREWGDRSFGLKDPNGIHIYFFQRLRSQEDNQ